MEQATTSIRQAGAEPVPGYRLIEPLGQGGFGEVWKCEAPGGLFKAIKFVSGGDGAGSPASQERAALERIKTLRHPFILSLERVEVVDDVLVVVMELADQSLHALHCQFRDQGEPGVPREDLLAYLVEASEALDWMNFEHGLQHLDVKPHNLFLVCNHLKVADFGLVHHLGEEGEQSAMRKGGVTPLYSAPELLRGSLSRHSDQYSLAVVYQQLLTGSVPFWHENVYDLMMQHLSADPDLVSLPEEDRPVIERALSKVPEQRFPSCLDFVHALMGNKGSPIRRSGKWRRVLTGDRPSGTHTPTAPGASTPVPTQPYPPPAAMPAPAGRRLHDTPTRPIRTLTPAQLAASEAAREALRPSPPTRALPEPLLELSSPAGADKTVHRPVPAPLPSDAQMPAPTAISLPGFRFVNCMNQTPLGDLWRAEDSVGNARRALCLLGFVRYDARLISHLQALRDPVLPVTEVHWSPAERLVVLTDWHEGTLRDRFEQRQAEGQPGIPRAELLALLRSAAEALDALYARHGLQHLGIHPRNLLVQGEKLWLSDFGLIPLVWLPTGQSAGTLNGRYSAPELFDRRPSQAADQYALALIFAEMMTGVHPRPHRPGSGYHRRPPVQGPSRSGATMRAVKLDLDLLPAHDRDIIARALASEPGRRFPSCVALIEALEQAGVAPVEPADRYGDLLAVIPFGILRGDVVHPDTFLPPIAKVVADLTRPRLREGDARTVHGPQNSRYMVRPDGGWEYRCPFQLIPGSMPLKVEGFRHHWGARVVEHRGESYTLLVDVPVPRSFWERVVKNARRVEVEIHVEAGPSAVRLTEARVRVSYPSDPDQQERILNMMAPQLFESVRVYLQATPEQRGKERWPLNDEIHVYPVLPDLEVAPTLVGTCKNISTGGISFRVAEKPPTEYLYLHLCRRREALGYALLAKVVRATETSDGWEVGAIFPPPSTTA